MEHQPVAQKPPVDDLFDSDVGYFEAGATIERLQGATIARMPGFESLAAGCVIQRIDPEQIPNDPDGWFEDIEKRLAGLGVTRARLYLQFEAPVLEDVLIRRGFRPRLELAVMKTHAPARDRSNEVAVRPIESETDWEEKRALHRRLDCGPDGHPAPPDLWVAMERRKCEAGYMTPYLIVAGEQVVGAANVAHWKGILRVKNVVVVPQYRRDGIGCASIGLLAGLAGPAGQTTVGAFAVADTPSLDMYMHAGFEIVSRQTEWCKQLAVSE